MDKYEIYIDEFIKSIIDSPEQIIGFSVQSTSKFFSLELARKIKEKDKNKIIIFGGPLCFKFAEIAKLFNFPYFHMFGYYKKEHLPLDSVQVNKEDTCHPNELGHLIVAKAIFTELKRYGFIDSNM